jgi:hypothetical protein
MEEANMTLAQAITLLWTVVSTVAVAFGIISLYHGTLSVNRRFRLWCISGLVLIAATTLFGLAHTRMPIVITFGIGLVIFLFYFFPVAALILNHLGLASKARNSYSEPISTFRAWAFGCLLGALVCSGLLASVPYYAIGISVVILLFLPYVSAFFFQ